MVWWMGLGRLEEEGARLDWGCQDPEGWCRRRYEGRRYEGYA